MRLRYNAPVILSYTSVTAFILLLQPLSGGLLIPALFAVPPTFDAADPWSYWRVFSHVLGHRDWSHYLGNFSFILLIGPILEEKFGSRLLLLMIAITALGTGLGNVLFFDTGLLGASGVVFMFIVLSSFTNFRKGEVPLTFVLIFVIYITKEFIQMGAKDDISQFAHILGALFGALFGFIQTRKGKAQHE